MIRIRARSEDDDERCIRGRIRTKAGQVVGLLESIQEEERKLAALGLPPETALIPEATP